METKSFGDKREYFRVRTRLRVGTRVVAEPEIEAISADILHREPAQPSRIDPELAQWIGRIERKLDALLQRLGAAADVDVLPGAEEFVVISGNGLLVPGEGKTLERGTTVLIELTLPEFAMRRIRALCIVPREAREEDEGGIPLTFVCIHETDRDAIIRHCLAVQRSEMRRAAGANAE